MPRKVLITGAAGFIGAALSIRLLQRGDQVIGLDNLNDYYDPSLSRRGCVRSKLPPPLVLGGLSIWLWKMNRH